MATGLQEREWMLNANGESEEEECTVPRRPAVGGVAAAHRTRPVSRGRRRDQPSRSSISLPPRPLCPLARRHAHRSSTDRWGSPWIPASPGRGRGRRGVEWCACLGVGRWRGFGGGEWTAERV